MRRCVLWLLHDRGDSILRIHHRIESATVAAAQMSAAGGFLPVRLRATSVGTGHLLETQPILWMQGLPGL